MFRTDCLFRRRKRSELRRDGERGKMQEQMLKWHKETGKKDENIICRPNDRLGFSSERFPTTQAMLPNDTCIVAQRHVCRLDFTLKYISSIYNEVFAGIYCGIQRKRTKSGIKDLVKEK